MHVKVSKSLKYKPTAKGPLVRDFLIPLDGPDLVQGADLGGKTPVHAEDGFVYDLEIVRKIVRA